MSFIFAAAEVAASYHCYIVTNAELLAHAVVTPDEF
jgi:hypothetical protein